MQNNKRPLHGVLRSCIYLNQHRLFNVLSKQMSNREIPTRSRRQGMHFASQAINHSVKTDYLTLLYLIYSKTYKSI